MRPRIALVDIVGLLLLIATALITVVATFRMFALSGPLHGGDCRLFGITAAYESLPKTCYHHGYGVASTAMAAVIILLVVLALVLRVCASVPPHEVPHG